MYISYLSYLKGSKPNKASGHFVSHGAMYVRNLTVDKLTVDS